MVGPDLSIFVEVRQRRGQGSGHDGDRMRALKAHVRGGRVVLDEPTELPDGTEIELTVIEDDDFEPEERARLAAALDSGIAAARAGDLVDADEVIRELLARQ